MGRLDCVYTLKKSHSSKTKTLNLSVKIEKNNQIISSNIDDLLVPDLSCCNCGDCFITKIQRCEKVELVAIGELQWKKMYVKATTNVYILIPIQSKILLRKVWRCILVDNLN
jgi:hypothetical protein